MSDRYVEKSFLYLLALSVLLHLAAFGVLSLIPPAKSSEQKVTMVDLTDLPELPRIEVPKAQEQPARDKPELKQRIAREPEVKERPPRAVQRPAPSLPAAPRSARAPRSAPADAIPLPSKKAEPARIPQETREAEPVARGEGIFRPKGGAVLDRARLFPSAGKLARLEESYRRKYGDEVEKGDTGFLDTQDIRFGSFLRRFENAVYGVWRYPEAAVQRGIQGTTPVRITFNRSGEIVKVDLLDSSGSIILDDEVLRTLKQLGPMGSLPKGYPNETFKLIAFFQYGIGGGRLH